MERWGSVTCASAGSVRSRKGDRARTRCDGADHESFQIGRKFKISPHDVAIGGRERLNVDWPARSRSPEGSRLSCREVNTAAVPLAPGRGLTMPTHTEISSHFAQSRGRGPLFTTVVVCFDDASEVMQVRVEIADSGDSGENRHTPFAQRGGSRCASPPTKGPSPNATKRPGRPQGAALADPAVDRPQYLGSGAGCARISSTSARFMRQRARLVTTREPPDCTRLCRKNADDGGN